MPPPSGHYCRGEGYPISLLQPEPRGVGIGHDEGSGTNTGGRRVQVLDVHTVMTAMLTKSVYKAVALRSARGLGKVGALLNSGMHPSPLCSSVRFGQYSQFYRLVNPTPPLLWLQHSPIAAVIPSRPTSNVLGRHSAFRKGPEADSPGFR